jgi:hypothetical protein
MEFGGAPCSIDECASSDLPAPGYAKWPPADAADRGLLLQLFAAVLAGDAELHTALVDALLQLSEACRAWREAGGTPAECLTVTMPVAKAVASLRVMVSPENSSSLMPLSFTVVPSWV